MRAEYNIREKRRLKSAVNKKDELLKAMDKEIENIKAHMVLKKAEAAEAIRLHAEASNFVTVEKSLQDEVNALNVRNIILEKERNAMDVKVADLEASTVSKERELTDLHAQLTSVKSHNDSLADQTLLRNPSAEADYISALQRLQSVNFSLLAELRSNKDASIETVINILRLDETLAERLGLNELPPHVDQLMAHIHHSLDKNVVGATSLSFALDVSNVRVRKIKENIAGQRSALRDVFIPLFEPFSAEVLTCAGGTSDTMPATVVATTALSTTLASASIVAPISMDDYVVAGTDDQAGTDRNADPFPNVDDAELNIL
nr:hypothetical protein [Tanacetum cinerariifolium]